MSRPHSVRRRLTIWYAWALAAGLLLLSVLIWFSMRARLMGEVEEDLVERAASLQAFVARETGETPAVDLKDELGEFCQGLPQGYEVALRGDQFRFFHKMNDVLKQNWRYRESTFNAGGREYHLIMGAPLHPVKHTLDMLALLLLGLMPVVVLIALAGGAWLSRRALQPVTEIAAAAQSIGIDSLATRLPSPGTGDELEQLTHAWNTMLQRLETAVGTLSQFATDASHELRTPLAIIRTNAEVALRRARTPESYQESLTEISEEAAHMTKLVEDLLSLARSGAPLRSTPLDLNEVIRQVVAEIGAVAAENHVVLRVHASPAMAAVRGNHAGLRRLFFILIDNAIKYSYSGGEVIVEILPGTEGQFVTVEDKGIGIPQAALPHIFKRFYQADASRSDRGFGLGLALAETIAQAHGATISVMSAEGKGARFTVAFPKAQVEVENPPAPAFLLLQG